MWRVLRIFKILGICISLVTLNLSVPSSAVEFGQDATGDPNAVKVGGGSGFLYSERIVLTVGHVIGAENPGAVPYWEREGVIYNPGIVTIAGQKQYKVKKVLIPSTYTKPDYANNIINDDNAVIILSEDIPMTKRAVFATEDQMQRFVREKSKVELVGYGITHGSQRPVTSINNRAPHKLTSTLISPEAVLEFYRKYPNVDWKKINKPGVYGIVQHRELKQSHICDGDSGSVFFVEENSIRYVLGTTGLGLVNNNCPPPEYEYPFPSMSWIDPNSKLRDLVKTAEKIVEEDRKREAEEIRLAAELRAKQEAEAKAKAEAEAKAKAEAEEKLRLDMKNRCIKFNGDLQLAIFNAQNAGVLYPNSSSIFDGIVNIAPSLLDCDYLNFSTFDSELQGKQRILATLEVSITNGIAAAQANAFKKPITITCKKGKKTIKVTKVNPKCPKGYKKK